MSLAFLIVATFLIITYFFCFFTYAYMNPMLYFFHCWFCKLHHQPAFALAIANVVSLKVVLISALCMFSGCRNGEVL